MDLAGDVKMKECPVAPETRRVVFVAAGSSEAMRSAWRRWAGETDFKDSPDGCGLVIYSSPAAPWITERLAAALLPFFRTGGAETAVFEFQPIGRNFIRREESWFLTPGRVRPD